jgi:hypothetical protein
MMDAHPAVPDPRAQTNGDARPARGTFRFREHTLRPDLGSDAEPVTFTMWCATCDAHGPDATDGDVGTAWAAKHLRANPAHAAYWEHIVRPYRFEPGAWL